MSEPPPQPPNTTVPPPILTTPYPTPYHRQQPQPQPQSQSHHHLPLREYRKGNWTLEETLILITAKRLDDERRINNAATPNASGSSRGATGELRWKWVENYCWSNRCLRSQNQCNDKWDNLLRDYKKVREYEVSLLSSTSASSSSSSRGPSYWEMDKNQRKDRGLPSNLILRIYEALNEVVQRKYITSHQSATTSTSTRVPTTLSIQSPPPMTMLPPPTLPLPPTLPPPPPPPTVAVGNSGATDSSETEGTGDEDDHSPKLDPETKRRKMRDIESSIVRSTSVLAQTLMKCEEKREKRHREIMEKEEQRLRIEETRTEMNRQGMSSLITSVNNLSTAIHALISDRRDKG